jgi:hypothetical protein
MRQLFLTLGLLLALNFHIHAASPAFANDHPWLTGPLLTPSARVVKVGHFLIEPYLYYTWVTARYGNDWEVISIPTVRQFNPLVQVKVGMTEKVDITCTFQGIVNTVNKRTSVGFGDLPLGFEFQLYNDGEESAKFTLIEIFPTGKFERLDPDKFGTDSIGQGSFITQFALTFARLFHFEDDRYLNVRLNVAGFLPTPTDVKGFNAYGGDETTYGRVFPGCALNVSFGAEYTLTENIALALDLLSIFDASSRFKGQTITPVGFRPGANFSIAPAIEYNWNSNVGVIVGSWFTLAGRNSSKFVSAAAAVNIFY